MVRLALRDGAGQRVLPALYSDNYLWLLPGESSDVVISWQGAAPLTGTPRVVADAYNATALTR
jgi:Exo-beta-D-glucosaminidase Ig-fold domain